MARGRDRIFALILAIVFFLTSIVAGLLVVWQSFTESSSSDSSTTTAESEEQEGEVLQGTQLEDFTPVDNVDELEIIDIKEGTGKEVKSTDTVTVDYTGAVASTGTIFQSSLDYDEQATFSLDSVIEGWTKGIPGMKEGGERRLIIPADMAYGDEPPEDSGIPKNAALVFDVTLHAVTEESESE